MTTAPRLCERHGCTDTVLPWLHPRYCSRRCDQLARGDTLAVATVAGDAITRSAPTLAARLEVMRQAFTDLGRALAELVDAMQPPPNGNAGAPFRGAWLDELDPRTRALEARRNRNTGPRPTRHRPPRTLDQKDRR